MESTTENPTHTCTVHPTEDLVFVCLSSSCLAKGLLCYKCRIDEHKEDTHEVKALNRLVKIVQESKSSQSVLKAMETHTSTVV